MDSRIPAALALVGGVACIIGAVNAWPALIVLGAVPLWFAAGVPIGMALGVWSGIAGPWLTVLGIGPALLGCLFAAFGAPGFSAIAVGVSVASCGAGVYFAGSRRWDDGN